MLDFAKTPMGRKFFESFAPNLVKAIRDLTVAVNENTRAIDDRTTMAGPPGPRAIPAGPPGPMGLVPLKLDESDITNVPAGHKLKALAHAFGEWASADADERRVVVEQLRNSGPMAAQRAATLLALTLQFEDVVRAAFGR